MAVCCWSTGWPETVFRPLFGASCCICSCSCLDVGYASVGSGPSSGVRVGVDATYCDPPVWSLIVPVVLCSNAGYGAFCAGRGVVGVVVGAANCDATV